MDFIFLAMNLFLMSSIVIVVLLYPTKAKPEESFEHIFYQQHKETFYLKDEMLKYSFADLEKIEKERHYKIQQASEKLRKKASTRYYGPAKKLRFSITQEALMYQLSKRRMTRGDGTIEIEISDRGIRFIDASNDMQIDSGDIVGVGHAFGEEFLNLNSMQRHQYQQQQLQQSQQRSMGGAGGAYTELLRGFSAPF